MTELEQTFDQNEGEVILSKDRFSFVPFSEQELNRKHSINLTSLVGSAVSPIPILDHTDLCDTCDVQYQIVRGEFTLGWGYPEERLEVVIEDTLQLKCGCETTTNIMGGQYQPVIHAIELIYKAVNSENPRALRALEAILPFADVEKIGDFTFNRRVNYERKTPPYIPERREAIILPPSEYTIK